MANLRTVVAYTVPVITALFGLFWFFGRKRPPPDRPPATGATGPSVDTTEVSENQDVDSTVKDHSRSSWISENVANANRLALESEKALEIVEEEVLADTRTMTHASTERLEEILTNERSQVVVSSVNLKTGKNMVGDLDIKVESGRTEAVSLDATHDDIHNESGIKPVSESITYVSVDAVKGKMNAGVISDMIQGKEGETSDIVEEKYRDSLNLEDYDYKSYTDHNVSEKCDTCDMSDSNLALNEAFITTGDISKNVNDTKSEVVSEVVSETIERTTAANTSMSMSVLVQHENSMVDQPLLESSSLVPSLLESSTLGQPVLESTKLDITASSLSKDIDSEHNYGSSLNSSEVKLKSDTMESVESKLNWAELSQEQSASCYDTESQSQLNVCVSEDVISISDSESNCSKNGSRHSVKDFSPEPHHKSGSSFDNGVTSSESNCDSASVDSGKGASIHDVPASSKGQEVIKPMPTHQTYQCNFPTSVCGRLIGKYGKNINMIKDRSGANISLNTNPFTQDFQLCVIEGTKKQIDSALHQISTRFPEVDLSPINMSMSSNGALAQGQGHPVLMPEIMQLNLPEGVSVDVVVSSIVDVGHIFLQQHTHPSFPSLERLNQFMIACYTTDGMVPQLPRPLEVGVICAAPMLNGWYRAQISCVYEDTDECDIKFVDYGGFSRVQASVLKQIRSDFMTLPFQATECYMANITPLQDEEYFSSEASAMLEMLTQGKLLQAQVVGRTEDGIPYVHIYQISGDNNVIFVNRELVNRGLTRWIEVLS